MSLARESMASIEPPSIEDCECGSVDALQCGSDRRRARWKKKKETTDDLHAIIRRLCSEVSSERLVAQQRQDEVLRHISSESKLLNQMIQDCISTVRSSEIRSPQTRERRRSSIFKLPTAPASAPRDLPTPAAVTIPDESTQTVEFIRAYLNTRETLEPAAGFNREYISRIVTGTKFEVCVAFVLAINLLLMCCEAHFEGLKLGYDIKYPKYDFASEDVRGYVAPVFMGFDWVFGIVFSAECVLKMYVYRLAYFRQCWHYIDMLCVLGFLVEKAVLVALPVQAHTLRLVRLFRLLRLLKLIGKLEQMDILHTMTTAIRSMAAVLVWAIMLLSVILVTCALILTQILQTIYFPSAFESSSSESDMARSFRFYEYFGTLSRCTFSMYELALANWPPVARLLAEDVSEWFFAVCVLHKLIIGFAVVGVINSVVLQETLKVAATDDIIMLRQKERQSKKLRAKLSALFHALDDDKDGRLEIREFMNIGAYEDVNYWLQALEVRTDDLQALFSYCDLDNDGYIYETDFLTMVPKFREPTRLYDLLQTIKSRNTEHR